MQQYEVLKPISPDRGLPILPAGEDMPPVIISEDELFVSPSDLSNEQRAKILIALDVIRPVAIQSAPASLVADNNPEPISVDAAEAASESTSPKRKRASE